MPPKLDGILESSLYVDDLQRSVRFIRKLRISVISDFGERGCAMRVAHAKYCCLQEGSLARHYIAARWRRRTAHRICHPGR